MPATKGWGQRKVLVVSVKLSFRWRFAVVWFALMGMFAAFLVSGENGFPAAEKLRRQRNVLELENSILKVSNERLRREIRLVRQEPSFLEWLAREKLGMIGDGERLYVFQ